jgi:hypothetical protein
MNLAFLIICLFACILQFAVGLHFNEKQREKEWHEKTREMYKECTGHYPEEAEAVAERHAQEFTDILKRQDLFKLQLMLVVPYMYHFTRDEAEDFARKIVRRKGLTKEDCVRIGYPRLARFAET